MAIEKLITGVRRGHFNLQIPFENIITYLICNKFNFFLDENCSQENELSFALKKNIDFIPSKRRTLV